MNIMVISRRLARMALALLALIAAACVSIITEHVLAQEAIPPSRIFILPGPTEKTLISAEDIPINNCDGRAELSTLVERSYTIARTIELGTGIPVNASGEASVPGMGEFGFGAAVATAYEVSYGSQERVTRSVTLAAREGTNLLYTIHQYEDWETGDLLVTGSDTSRRISYRFRKDFSIEALPPVNIGCPNEVIPAPTEALLLPTVPATTTLAPAVDLTVTPTFSQRVIDNIATNPVGLISAFLVFVVGIITAITQIVRLQREHPGKPKK